MPLPELDNLVRIGKLKAEYEGDIEVDAALLRVTAEVAQKSQALLTTPPAK